ncbi:MAG: hypothetical protein ACFFEL_09500 [Candidatus Thorarchaeota archaeon]
MVNHKLKLVALSVALIMMCSIIPRIENPIVLQEYIVIDNKTPAAVEWSEDFDDGNISDWSIYGFVGPPPYTNPPGNFTAEDAMLRANGSVEMWSQAFINSSVAYGTWEFDVDVVDTYNHEIVIPFIMIEWTLANLGIRCYFIQIVTGLYENDARPRLQAGKCHDHPASPAPRGIDWYDDYLYEDMLGWKHFIITRQDNGQVYVYMNGTLATSWKDNEHTTCKEFSFGTGPGPAIDNIVVYDNITYDAVPPEWDQVPVDQTIDFGQDFRYDLNATDSSGVEAWELNDTTNFTIDSNGIITNLVDLESGRYSLNVSVSDSLGYTRSAQFDVIVNPPPPPPDLTIYLLWGGGGIVIVALVVLLMRKR